MNISSSTASLSNLASSKPSRPQGPPPGGKDQLSSALQSIGVDDSTAASVLEQRMMQGAMFLKMKFVPC